MSAFPDTPKTLLSRMAAQVTGESEASWVRFFDLYQPVIRKFAEYVGAKGEAEDVTQDVFVKLVEAFRNGLYQPSKGRFRAYLAAMIRHEVVNRWQKGRARAADRHVSIDDDNFSLEVGVPSETAAVIDAKWKLARHAAAIEHVLTKTALSQQSKDIYWAYVLEERPIAEAAKFMLYRSSIPYYVKGEAYDKAAEAVVLLKANVKDVPAEVVAEIISKATVRANKEKAPRLFELYQQAKTQATAEKDAKELRKKAASSANRRKLAEALATAGNWQEALKEFASLTDQTAQMVKGEQDGSAKSAALGEFWWTYKPTYENAEDTFKIHAAVYYRKALAAGEITGLKKNIIEQRVKEYGDAAASVPAATTPSAAEAGSAWQEKGNAATLTLKNGVKIDFVKCPAGSFKMVIDLKSKKKIPVTITRPFWFSKTVLTKLQMVSLAGGSDGIPPQVIQPYSYAWYTAGDDVVLPALNKDFGSCLPKGYVFRPPTWAEYQYAYHADAKDENEPYYSYPRSHWLLKSLKKRDPSWSELGETCNGWGIFDLYKSSFVLDKLVGMEGTVAPEQAKDSLQLESVRPPDSTSDPFYWQGSPSKWVTRINWRGSGVVLSLADRDRVFFHLVVGPDLVSEWKAKNAKK